MLVTTWQDEWVEDDEIICMFPDRFKGVEYDNTVPNNPIEKDPELGLEIVQKPTIYDKYGIELDPRNSFHRSVQSFFDKNGFITDKQKNCFN